MKKNMVHQAKNETNLPTGRLPAQSVLKSLLRRFLKKSLFPLNFWHPPKALIPIKSIWGPWPESPFLPNPAISLTHLNLYQNHEKTPKNAVFQPKKGDLGLKSGILPAVTSISFCPEILAILIAVVDRPYCEVYFSPKKKGPPSDKRIFPAEKPRFSISQVFSQNSVSRFFLTPFLDRFLAVFGQNPQVFSLL